MTCFLIALVAAIVFICWCCLMTSKVAAHMDTEFGDSLSAANNNSRKQLEL